MPKVPNATSVKYDKIDPSLFLLPSSYATPQSLLKQKAGGVVRGCREEVEHLLYKALGAILSSVKSRKCSFLGANLAPKSTSNMKG